MHPRTAMIGNDNDKKKICRKSHVQMHPLAKKSALMEQLRYKAVEQKTLSSPLRMAGRRIAGRLQGKA